MDTNGLTLFIEFERDGITLPFEFSVNASIKDIVKIIGDDETIFFKDRELNNMDELLSDIGVCNESVIKIDNNYSANLILNNVSNKSLILKKKNLYKTYFDKCRLTLEDCRMEYTTFKNCYFENNEDWILVSYCSFTDCRFNKSMFNGKAFYKCNFINCHFTKENECNDMIFSDCETIDILFSNNYIVGLQFYPEINNVTITNCRLEIVNLYRIYNSTFKDCTLFIELEGVTIEDSSFENVNFTSNLELSSVLNTTMKNCTVLK